MFLIFLFSEVFAVVLTAAEVVGVSSKEVCVAVGV